MNEELLDTGCSLKLANFLAVAWEMPTEYVSEIFLNTESIEERNNLIHIECFAAYMFEYHNISNIFDMEDDELTELFNEYEDSFFAESVRLNFCN